MSGPLTTAQAVSAALVRPLTANETNAIDELIAQLGSDLRSKMPTIDERIAAWSLVPRPTTAVDPARVSAKLAAVLKRYLVNVEGAASTSRTDGPFTRSMSFASYGRAIAGGSPGELEVTDSDVDDLNSTTRSRAGTIRLAQPGWCSQ